MNYYEAKPDGALMQSLLAMSAAWAEEKSTRGYCANAESDLANRRIFVAEEDGRILGYLFGYESASENCSSVMAEGTPCFEVEELYVEPACRGRGIGKALFALAEETVKADGAQYLLLSTSTKDYKRILHLYIEELGMEFWSARLFKRICLSAENERVLPK